jgi:hypothetical protein
MAFPYGGFPITHDSNRQDWEAAIGLAMVRLDGFSAWEASERGELLTSPFKMDGDRLFINSLADRGHVSVEMQDEAGKPIRGFGLEACVPMQGDSLKVPDAGRVIWRGDPDMSRLRGKFVRLKFLVDHAQLYSFRLGNSDSKSITFPHATDH